jgi:UDP-glucuronate decarboxylase
VLPQFSEIYPEDLKAFNVEFDYEPKSVLITGSQGMLGNGLAQTFFEYQKIGYLQNTKLLLASRYWNAEAMIFWKNERNIQLMTNIELLKYTEEIDLVLHTASPSNVMSFNTYDELTAANRGLLEAITKLRPKKVLFISSGEVYKGQKSDEDVTLPEFSFETKRDWYPKAKIEAEQYLFQSFSTSECRKSIVRLFHTFGPGLRKDDGRSFSDFLWNAAEGKDLLLKSTGSQIRTFLYLSDAIDAITRIAFSDDHQKSVFNVGSAKPLSVREFAKKVASIYDKELNVSLDLNFTHSQNEVIIPNIEKIMKLGWSPRVTLKAGINKTVDWMKKNASHYNI